MSRPNRRAQSLHLDQDSRVIDFVHNTKPSAPMQTLQAGPPAFFETQGLRYVPQPLQEPLHMNEPSTFYPEKGRNNLDERIRDFVHTRSRTTEADEALGQKISERRLPRLQSEIYEKQRLTEQALRQSRLQAQIAEKQRPSRLQAGMYQPKLSPRRETEMALAKLRSRFSEDPDW